MALRQLGWTNLQLTTIGLGTWALGGGEWRWGWGPQDDQESRITIQRALDLGINWIDTAAVYGLGRSEEVIGKTLQGMVKKPVIATKCSLVWDEDRMISNSLKRGSVRQEAEDSLRRLGVEAIDLYQIHWPDPEQEIEEGWGTIADLIKEGKIRYAGVSNFNVEQLKRIQPIHRVASLQPPYSILRRGIEDEILDYCSNHDIGVIVYSPMQKGILTDKFSKDWAQNLPDSDHRARDSRFQEPELSVNVEFVKRLSEMAKDKGKTVAQLAIAWTLRRPEVTAAIVGARKPHQIEETVHAGEWELDKNEIEQIDELLEARSDALEKVK
ncbi:MAG TPA: aldo/keto reductase [Anaerolineae bacterium]|nr:aldo/keto reductase [Anaerolineae bacterium]